MLSLADHYPVPHFIPTLTNDEFRRFTPTAVCPTCRGEGSFLWDYDENGPVAAPIRWQCDCLSQIILNNYLMRCGLNPHLYWRTAKDLLAFERGEAELGEYVSSPNEYAQAGIGLSLTGDPVNGKSTWATFLMKVFIAEQWDVQCMSLDTLADSYTATWARKGKTEQHQQTSTDWFTDRILKVPVLLIDNIGRNDKRNDFSTVQQAFLRITSERLETGRVTLMTFSGKSETSPVPLDHLTATTLTVNLRGPDLSTASRQRVIADIQAGIHRPLRLI
jgi:hypothetical protein